MVMINILLLNKIISTTENFTTTLKQANLASKKGIASFAKKTAFDDKLQDLNTKITSVKTKHVLVEN